MKNYEDWLKYIPDLPKSCCDLEEESICQADSKYLHQQGCLAPFSQYIETRVLSMGALGLSLALIQVKTIKQLLSKTPA